MAKISELVKTYKLLNDPKAPDWSVKFVGAGVAAIAIVAAIGAYVWVAHGVAEEPELPAAARSEEKQAPGDLRTCEPTEVAEEMTRLGTTSLPPGHTLPSGCVIG